MSKRYEINITRHKDGLTKKGRFFKFIEWDSDEVGARMVEYHDTPPDDTPFSLIIDPSISGYTWLTTPIKEYLIEHYEDGELYMELRTKNSFYTLTKKLKNTEQ